MNALDPLAVMEHAATTGDYRSLREALERYQEKLVLKWRWLLEGTAHPKSKDRQLPKINERLWPIMAQVFENQVALTRLARPSAAMLFESTPEQISRMLLEDAETVVSDFTLPVKHSLPIIRKVFPALIAMKICSIQPMPLTSGGTTQAFYLDVYRQTGGEVSVETADSDYAYNTELGVPKKLNLKITSTSVTASKDILGVTWSHEAMVDARYSLGIDVESELVNAAAEEILRELDQRVLMEILDGAAAGNVNWSSTMGSGYTTAKDWYETLGHAFIDAQAYIDTARFQDADFIIAGTTLYPYIAKMPDFTSVKTGPDTGEAPGIKLATEFMGTIKGGVDVYKSHVITAAKGIVGYYPKRAIDGGYIWMPYEPLSPRPVVYADYDDSSGAYTNQDAYTRNLATRNGKLYIHTDAYATITVT